MTTETNAERLETIRQRKAIFTGFNDNTAVMLSEEDYVFIIQQAERVQELEKEVEVTRWDMAELATGESKLRKENARLRKALEYYADEEKYKVSIGERSIAFYTVLIDGGKTARQALEGSE